MSNNKATMLGEIQQDIELLNAPSTSSSANLSAKTNDKYNSDVDSVLNSSSDFIDSEEFLSDFE